MKIYLIRHAESLGNINGKLTSITDLGLTEKGHLQAHRIGLVLSEKIKAERIYACCSPMLRARETLDEILKCLETEQVTLVENENLREMDLGALEGMPFAKQTEIYPEIDLATKLSVLQAPEGENYHDVKKRVQLFLEELKSHYDQTAHILIVSHGITLRVLINLLLQREDADVDYLNWLENTSQTVLVYREENKSFEVECLNDYRHLRELKTADYNQWGIFVNPDVYLSKSMN